MFVRLTSAVLLLYIFSLGFMRPFVFVAGAKIQISDAIFPVLLLLTAAGLLRGTFKIPKSRFLLLLAFFTAAMALSALVAEDSRAALLKLAGKVYLAAIPAVCLTLITSSEELRRSLKAFLAGAAVCAAVGLLAAVVYYIDRDNWLLTYTLFHKGTLPPGDYPRIAATFLNANMLANYLNVAFMFVIALLSDGVIGRVWGILLLISFTICALLTISPGIGGFFFALALWELTASDLKKAIPIRKAGIFAALATAAAFLFVAAVSTARQPDPLFTFDIPFTEIRLEPSARMLTWSGAIETFASDPVLGRGLGSDTCLVRYDDLSGRLQTLTDAHNTFLNVAAESGVFGLASILLISIFFVRSLKTHDPFLKALVIAFASAFVYQGLTGSFEDARHLWVLMGLILAGSAASESCLSDRLPQRHREHTDV